MSRAYEFLTPTTRRADSPEWKEKVLPPPMTDVSGRTQEAVLEERRDGDGYLWGTTMTTETYLDVTPHLLASLEAQLAEARIKLDEQTETIDELRQALDRVASASIDCEAMTVSMKSAMLLLLGLEEKHSIHEDELAKRLNGADDWLSLAWLMKSGFVEHAGSYLSITDRGTEIVEAVFSR